MAALPAEAERETSAAHKGLMWNWGFCIETCMVNAPLAVSVACSRFHECPCNDA